ncbi:ABC transporter permease [Rhizomonospora bruguierae]|uniref:ABC transporter permease n=1 Tax=Rhizomonospora bruguierae TaxID=1581705 RepID=UPI001BCB662B|nr:ABC transporter permease [Micromonospora sp. NBRC 107566]
MRALAIVETKLLLRQPAWLFTVVIPLFVLAVFGLTAGGGTDPGGGDAHGGAPATPAGDSRSLTGLAAMSVAIGIALVAFYQVPTTLASYREQGILRRLATTPVRPAALLAVQLVLQVGLAVVAGALIVASARLGVGVPLPRDPLAFAAAFVLGVAALFGVGLLIAALAPNGRAANGVGVLLYFPCAFLAGLMLPVAGMPPAVAAAGRFTPLGAFREALLAAWAGGRTDPLPLVIMAAWAIALAAAAARYFRWE